MSYINTSLFIREDLQRGLESGRLIRQGGTIREAGTQKIVALLRDGPAQISQIVSNLSTIGSVASILNVVVSAVGFAMVLSKLDGMDKKLDKILDKLDNMSEQLDRVETKIDQVHNKLDAQSRANFLHAIEQLQLALNMKHGNNRDALLYRVVDRLGEARQLFFNYAQSASKVKFATEYSNFYLLCSLSQSVALLELDEVESAKRIIKQVTEVNNGNKTCYLVETYVSKIQSNLETRGIKDITVHYAPFKVPAFAGGHLRVCNASIYSPQISVGENTPFPPSFSNPFQSIQFTMILTNSLFGNSSHKSCSNSDSNFDKNEYTSLNSSQVYLLNDSNMLLNEMGESFEMLKGFEAELKVINEAGLTWQEWKELPYHCIEDNLE